MQGESLSSVLDFPKGSVLGPLVIAGISMREDRIPELTKLGVKDSKRLTISRRETVNKKLQKLEAKIAFVRIQPSEIDKIVLKGEKYRKLNFLEAKAMAEVIDKLKPNVAFVDASDTSCERYRRQILDELDSDLPIVSEHKADETYPIVSAASILAKVERDRCIKSIHERWGNIGTGYPSDQTTKEFLKDIINREKNLPKFVRRSWKTVRRILENQEEETR
jgi:ribonuclease HII